MIKDFITSFKKILMGIGIRCIIFSYLILYATVLRIFPASYYTQIDRWTSRLIRRYVSMLGLKINVHGSIPHDKKVKIIACQHQGGMETIVGLDIFGNSVYVVSEHLLKIPLAKRAFLTRKGHVLITRTNPMKDFLRFKEWIKKNKWNSNPDQEVSLVIFPEGRRMKQNERTSMKGGLVAIKKLLPYAKIYPVTLNSGLFWSKFFDISNTGVIDINIHKPLANNLSSQEINQKIESIFYN